jgi:hypothetical protein
MWSIPILYPAGKTWVQPPRTSTLNAAMRASTGNTSDQMSPIAAAPKRSPRAMRRNSTHFVTIGVDRVAAGLTSRALSTARDNPRRDGTAVHSTFGQLSGSAGCLPLARLRSFFRCSAEAAQAFLATRSVRISMAREQHCRCVPDSGRRLRDCNSLPLRRGFAIQKR